MHFILGVNDHWISVVSIVTLKVLLVLTRDEHDHADITKSISLFL